MKNKLKKIFYPSNFIVVTGAFTIIISLIYLIFYNGFGTKISYVLYLLMTYFLILILIKIYNIIRTRVNSIINNNKYLSLYKNDHVLRYRVSLLLSLGFNICYFFFKLISGIVFKSVWFIVFALYYILLVVLRTNIVKQELNGRSSMKDEYDKYRNTAIILLSMNVVLTMIILVIVNEKIMNIYPDWIAISVACYTFYLVFISIYNLIKYRKFKSPLISASKVINVITSFISLISLEMVLIPTFGNDLEFFEIMIMSTGGMIGLIIIVISLYMIIKATEWLNDNKV